jgi:hypothetical protein
MWGSRTRDRKRRRLHDHHTFESIRENIKKTSFNLRSSKPKKVHLIQQEIQHLATEQAQLNGRVQIRKYRAIGQEIVKKQNELEFIENDKHVEEFVELVKPLLGETKNDAQLTRQQKHTVFLNLFYKDKAIPCFIDRDVCQKCNTELLTLTQESMNMCPKCGTSEHLIYCTSDFIQNEEIKNNQYERGPLYRKYLMQFHEEAPDPPEDVINIVYRHLSKVHIMLSSKVKPTPISQILREEGLQKWSAMSVRIAKIINREPIVKLSTVLIDRLVVRFNKITHAFSLTKKKERKKIMNFEFLTKQFLIMEKRYDLSEWYSLHKTRAVLFSADNRLERCCKAMANDDLDWEVARSC